MALWLTLLSIVLYYFSPDELVPALAPFHLQLFILGAAAVVTLISFNRSDGKFWSTQTVLVFGFWFAIVVSALSRGWLHTSFNDFVAFGPAVCVFCLVAANADSLDGIGKVCHIMSLCAVVLAVEGLAAYYFGFRGETLLWVKVVDGVVHERIKSGGQLNDPNDFAQFLLVGLAFLGILWRKANPIRNLVLVAFPAALLLYAIYLTGSRGAIFGIAAIAFVLASRRMGVVPAALLAAAVIGLAVAARFGGGRELSLHEGDAAGRVAAWGSGIAQLRSNPLFGVGLDRFTEFNDQTAHNSFVLCFAETGFFGYFFWLALLVTTMLGLDALDKLHPATADDAAYRRSVTAVRAAFYAFLATAWFLSRTYTLTLYIIVALGAVLINLRRQQAPQAAVPMLRWVPLTFAVQVALVAVVYAVIRLRAF